MSNWPKAILDWVKLKPKYLVGVATVCFVVVLLPKELREFLGYESIIKPYRGWISLIGLVCGVYGFVVTIAGLKPSIQKKWRSWLLKKTAAKKLMALPRQEKMYLAEYIRKDASSLKFCLSTGQIAGLEAKDIVYLASKLSSSGDIFPYNIQPWVSEAIEKDTDLKSHILEFASQEDLEDTDYY